MNTAKMMMAVLGTVLLTGVAVMVLAQDSRESGERSSSSVGRELTFRYASVEGGKIAPGFLDLPNKVYYVYRNIHLDIEDVPEATRRHVHIALLEPKEAGVAVIEVDAPICLARGDDGKLCVGYFLPSRSIFFRWKGSQLSEERAAKEYPVMAKAPLDLVKGKVEVKDIVATPESSGSTKPAKAEG